MAAARASESKQALGTLQQSPASHCVYPTFLPPFVWGVKFWALARCNGNTGPKEFPYTSVRGPGHDPAGEMYGECLLYGILSVL